MIWFIKGNKESLYILTELREGDEHDVIRIIVDVMYYTNVA